MFGVFPSARCLPGPAVTFNSSEDSPGGSRRQARGQEGDGWAVGPCAVPVEAEGRAESSCVGREAARRGFGRRGPLC